MFEGVPHLIILVTTITLIDAQLCAIHAGRSTIQAKDIQLVRRIRGKRNPSNYEGKKLNVPIVLLVLRDSDADRK
jgi:hypothetical protein